MGRGVTFPEIVTKFGDRGRKIETEATGICMLIYRTHYEELVYRVPRGLKST